MKQELILNYTEPRLAYHKGQEWSLTVWRKKVLARDKYRCKNCKNTVYDCYRRSESRLEAHHIIPRRHGGRNTLKNGITLCTFCHHYVGYVYERYGLDFRQLAQRKPKSERVNEARKGLKYSYLRYLRKIVEYY